MEAVSCGHMGCSVRCHCSAVVGGILSFHRASIRCVGYSTARHLVDRQVRVTRFLRVGSSCRRLLLLLQILVLLSQWLSSLVSYMLLLLLGLLLVLMLLLLVVKLVVRILLGLLCGLARCHRSLFDIDWGSLSSSGSL